MPESRGPSLQIVRGLFGALIGGVASVALVAVLAGGSLCTRWLITEAPQDAREVNLREARENLRLPVLGCATIGACAGWATLAPAGRHRFARSLAIIFLGSVLVWCVGFNLDVTPRRYKDTEHPLLYPAEALLIFGAPILVTAVLTASRIYRANHVSAKPAVGESRS